MVFQDRTDAGRLLAQALRPYQDTGAMVFALPRGGVVVGYEVARELDLPLDVLVVRKIGAPGQPELGIGAIGPRNVLVLNKHLIDYLGIEEASLESRIQQETVELERRLKLYRGSRPFPSLHNQTAILVDDGLATGSTARAAIEAVRAMDAGRIVLAVPVGAETTLSQLRRQVDDLVCLEAPENFESVSLWYRHFQQTSDTEVITLLERAWCHERGDIPSQPQTINPP